jgi:hypothetical protein
MKTTILINLLLAGASSAAFGTKGGKNFDHGVTGIPTVVVCDLKGEIVTKTQSLAELETLVK